MRQYISAQYLKISISTIWFELKITRVRLKHCFSFWWDLLIRIIHQNASLVLKNYLLDVDRDALLHQIKPGNEFLFYAGFSGLMNTCLLAGKKGLFFPCHCRFLEEVFLVIISPPVLEMKRGQVLLLLASVYVVCVILFNLFYLIYLSSRQGHSFFSDAEHAF